MFVYCNWLLSKYNRNDVTRSSGLTSSDDFEITSDEIGGGDFVNDRVSRVQTC